jgi:hypothetical protein
MHVPVRRATLAVVGAGSRPQDRRAPRGSKAISVSKCAPFSRADCADHYLEIGLGTGFCYNPLHNDLDRVRRGICGRHTPHTTIVAADSTSDAAMNDVMNQIAAYPCISTRKITGSRKAISCRKTFCVAGGYVVRPHTPIAAATTIRGRPRCQRAPGLSLPASAFWISAPTPARLANGRPRRPHL